MCLCCLSVPQIRGLPVPLDVSSPCKLAALGDVLKSVFFFFLGKKGEELQTYRKPEHLKRIYFSMNMAPEELARVMQYYFSLPMPSALTGVLSAAPSAIWWQVGTATLSPALPASL